MEETINDRMEMLVNSRFDGNKAAFAKAIGIPPTMMSSYISKQRRSKPNIDMVTSIVVNLNVDPMWLLTGEKSAKNEVHTNGDYSPASVHGNVTVGDAAVLKERVAMLEKLLEEKERTLTEKERTIQILMKQ